MSLFKRHVLYVGRMGFIDALFKAFTNTEVSISDLSLCL